jgi:hypothetical protein
LRALAFLLLVCGAVLAAPVSQNYLCVQGHEQDATTKLQELVKQSVTDFFKERDIAIDASTLQVNLSSSTQTGGDSPSYVSFTGSAAGGGSQFSGTSVAATVAAQDGTKFNVLLSSGSDNQDAAEYRVVSTQRGFDKEGNAIDHHCALTLYSGDSEATKSLLIINAASGHVLGRIRVPSRISLY